MLWLWTVRAREKELPKPKKRVREAAEPPAKPQEPAEDINKKDRLGKVGKIATLTLQNNALLYLRGRIVSEDVNMLVDTGASENFMARTLV